MLYFIAPEQVRGQQVRLRVTAYETGFYPSRLQLNAVSTGEFPPLNLDTWGDNWTTDPLLTWDLAVSGGDLFEPSVNTSEPFLVPEHVVVVGLENNGIGGFGGDPPMCRVSKVEWVIGVDDGVEPPPDYAIDGGVRGQRVRF